MMTILSIASCLNPPANFGIGELFACIGELTFGSLQLAGIVFFLVMLYLMWQWNIPKEAGLPLGVGYLFVMLYWFAFPAFLSFTMLGIIIIGILFILGFLAFFRRSGQ